MYQYKAICNRVIDGDTIEVTLDLGFNIFRKETIRLNNVDTPESRTLNLVEKQAGLLVKELLINVILNKEIYITTFKEEKYGRYLGEIFSSLEDTVSLNQMMVDEGFAKVYNGSQRTWDEIQLNAIIEKLT